MEANCIGRRSGGNVGSHCSFTTRQHRESASTTWVRTAVLVTGGCYRICLRSDQQSEEEGMRKLFGGFAALLVIASLGFVRANRDPYRVVFDLTSRDTLEQKAVLRWLREVGTSSPDAQMEVVMYGKGFELVMPERSGYTADVQAAIRNPNVKFKVCAIALRNNNIDKSQLLPGIETVPDGIYELVSRQQDHWGYIKVMH